MNNFRLWSPAYGQLHTVRTGIHWAPPTNAFPTGGAGRNMRLLLLAGTPEAVQIGHAISREDRIAAVASVARGGRVPTAMNLPMRIGGWGGSEAFADWLFQEQVDAVIDATHPFASRISLRTAEVCNSLGIPYVQFLRPAWTPREGDSWAFLNSEEEAHRHIPEAATVLLGTGRHRLDAFSSLRDRTVWVQVQDLNGTAFPFQRGGFLHRPSRLSVETEVAGLHAIGIDWIIARNAGGVSGTGLIEAARQLGVPVGMIRRPPQPEAPRVQSVAEALAWVRRRL